MDLRLIEEQLVNVGARDSLETFILTLTFNARLVVYDKCHVADDGVPLPQYVAHDFYTLIILQNKGYKMRLNVLL